jgi:cell shape-determining protein MreC
MIMTCELCGSDFLTEADPHVIRPTSRGYLHYCSCMIIGHDQISGIDKLQAENIELKKKAQMNIHNSAFNGLLAENKRLREALESIQNNTDSSCIFNWAEEALKKE